MKDESQKFSWLQRTDRDGVTWIDIRGNSTLTSVRTLGSTGMFDVATVRSLVVALAMRDDAHLSVEGKH